MQEQVEEGRDEKSRGQKNGEEKDDLFQTTAGTVKAAAKAKETG